MLPLAAISAGASLVGAGVSGVQAIRQKKAADKIKVGEEKISQESKDALAMQRNQATAGFAGKDTALEQQGAVMANTLSKAKGKGRIAMLRSAMQQSSDNALNLAMQDAQAREANQKAYAEALQGMGAKKEEMEARKIDRAAQTKANLLQASSANLQGMLQGTAGAAEALGMGAGDKKKKKTDNQV